MKHIFFSLSSFVILFGIPALMQAQTSGGSGGGTRIQNPLKSDTLMELLNAILDIMIRIGTPIIVLAFIFVGFKFVEARGNPTKIAIAKNMLLYTAIGTAVLLGAQALSMLISNTVNLF